MTSLVIVTTPTLSAFQLIVCSVFFVNSAAKKFTLSLGYYPLDGITRDNPPPSSLLPYLPSDATDLRKVH